MPMNVPVGFAFVADGVCSGRHFVVAGNLESKALVAQSVVSPLSMPAWVAAVAQLHARQRSVA